MKILLVNYRYFVSGGPERYLFNVTELLESKGHAVVPFSIAYERNEPTQYARYFASPLSDSSEVYFKDQSKSVSSITKSLARLFYSREVYQSLTSLIDDEKPDVALVLHYLRKLSPSVVKCLHDHRVPFVVRVSDFGMICPNAHLFRDGQICELCITGSLRKSVKHRCVQGSLGASAVNYAATRFHQAAGYYDLIRTFAVPSRFTMGKMAQGGFSPDRLMHLPTFVNSAHDERTRSVKPYEVVYVGRVDQLKGVHVLLDAVRQLNERGGHLDYRVRIIGSAGDAIYMERLRAVVEQYSLRNVTFEGSVSETSVRAALQAATCSVAPSIWYENMPNSVLESMAEGTPAIASAHGSFPEIIRDGETGLLVPPNDPAKLADAIGQLLADPSRAETLGHRAAEFVAQHHSPEQHYQLLLEAFARERKRLEMVDEDRL